MSDLIYKHYDAAAAYAGYVRITLKHGKKPFKVIETHNEGTAEFMRYLLHCAKGDATDSMKPGYIRLFKDWQYETSALNYDLVYDSIGAVKSDSTSASVIISFIIPDTIAAGKEIQALQLYSNMPNKADRVLYAQVNQGIDINIPSTDNINIDIEWQLTLSLDKE